MGDFLERLEELEGIVADLNKRIEALENPSEQKGAANESTWKRNGVSDYMIKVVYPGIYMEKDKPTAAFPKNRRKIAEKIVIGQYMFIYATSPEKKILGLTKVISSIKEVEGRWPYLVELEWVVGPKPGLRFKDVGLDIRPLPGDTLFSITEEKAQEIIQSLEEQPDLDQGMIDYLAKKYKEQ